MHCRPPPPPTFGDFIPKGRNAPPPRAPEKGECKVDSTKAEVEQIPKRDLPKSAGASLKATMATKSTKLSDKPIYAAEEVRQGVKPFGRKERKIVAARTFVADDDLTYYLRIAFPLREGGIKTLKAMLNKAKAYLATFDMTGYTLRDQHRIMHDAVSAALVPDDVEQTFRKSFARANIIESIAKQDDFAKTGTVKKAGFFSSAKKLPSA